MVWASHSNYGGKKFYLEFLILPSGKRLTLASELHPLGAKLAGSIFVQAGDLKKQR